MKLTTQQRRLRNTIKVIVVTVPTLFLFQNCGPGFSSQMLGSQLNLGSGGGGGGSFSLAAERLTCVPNSRGKAEVDSRRLTRSELRGSLQAIFGDAFVTKSSIQGALENISADTSQSYGRNFDGSLNSSFMNGVIEIAEQSTEALLADRNLLSSTMNGCNPDANLQACVDELVSGFALKVLRRPLPADSKAEILGLMNAESGIEKLRVGVARLLISPYFYQHIETGLQVEGDRVRLTPFEVASRLSYRLTGQAPDQELLTLASGDKLKDLSQIAQQAKRLFAKPAAKEHVREFFTHWLHLEKTVDPDPKISKLLGISGAGLGSEAREELLRFVDYVVFEKNGSFSDLLANPAVFPFTDRLAKLYGTTRSDKPFLLTDGRGGIAIRAATLMNNSLPSNPIVRGVFLRSRLLCTPIPAPDPALVAARLAETQILSHKDLSNRVFVEKTTGVDACMACHRMINPIGFSLEGYDGFGMPRSKEKVYDDNAEVVAEHAIDTYVDNLAIAAQPVPVMTAVDLRDTLAASGKVKQCITQQFIEFSRERAPSASDGCGTNESVDVLEAKGTLQDFFLSTSANEDIFWKMAQ